MENDSEGTEADKEEIDSRDMENIYGADKLHEKELDKDRRKYVVLTPAQFDDHEVIDRLERSVAYNRDPRFKNELKELSESALVPKKAKNTTSHESGEGNRILFDSDVND